jgi:hypothetical protein
MAEPGPARSEGKFKKKHFKVEKKDRVKIEEVAVTEEAVRAGAKHLIAETRMDAGTAVALNGAMHSESKIA